LARRFIHDDDRLNAIFHHQVDVLDDRRHTRYERYDFHAGSAGLRYTPRQFACKPRPAGGFADPIAIAQHREPVPGFGVGDQRRDGRVGWVADSPRRRQLVTVENLEQLLGDLGQATVPIEISIDVRRLGFHRQMDVT
jgi:hypothetical protein